VREMSIRVSRIQVSNYTDRVLTIRVLTECECKAYVEKGEDIAITIPLLLEKNMEIKILIEEGERDEGI